MLLQQDQQQKETNESINDKSLLLVNSIVLCFCAISNKNLCM